MHMKVIKQERTKEDIGRANDEIQKAKLNNKQQEAL